jgi:hypothetical protein
MPTEAVFRDLLLLGRLSLVNIAILIASLIIARFVGSLGRKCLLGLAVLTCLVLQARSLVVTYRHTGLYQSRKIMSLSDLQVVDNIWASRLFSGKDILPLLVADYMPRAKIFLYDENLYSKELLGWSGRDPNTTFVVGGYEPTVHDAFKQACLGRPHVLYKGRASVPIYIATPLSIYEKEEQVFLMRDEAMNYLIPGSWRTSRHE